MMAFTGEGEDLATNGHRIRDQGVLLTLCAAFRSPRWLILLLDGVEDVDDGVHRRGRGLGDKWTSDS